MDLRVEEYQKEEEVKVSTVNGAIELTNSSEKSSMQEEKGGRKSSVTTQPLAFSN